MKLILSLKFNIFSSTFSIDCKMPSWCILITCSRACFPGGNSWCILYDLRDESDELEPVSSRWRRLSWSMPAWIHYWSTVIKSKTCNCFYKQLTSFFGAEFMFVPKTVSVSAVSESLLTRCRGCNYNNHTNGVMHLLCTYILHFAGGIITPPANGSSYCTCTTLMSINGQLMYTIL